MAKEELAKRLNGRGYGSEIYPVEAQLAKANGLVVVFGASDDLMELRGAVNDEASGSVWLTPEGMFDNGGCDCDCKYLQAARDKAVEVKAVWGKGEWSFQYETTIPHATFEIYDDEEKYCRGIVFALANAVKP